MRRHMLFLFAFILVLAGRAYAQETRLQAEFRKETTSFKNDCLKFKLGCAEVLFTGQPLHIAVGSIAPQNGFGAGPAFVYHWDIEKTDWRVKLNADGLVSMNGSWRAGVYVKAAKFGGTTVQSLPTFNAYVQATSLNKVAYYGLGPQTTRDDVSYFGMRETIVGMSVFYPVAGEAIKSLNLSLYGEANGRLVDIRGSRGSSGPSIEQVYTEASAPGLTSQPGFAQFGEGVRVRPKLGDYLRLNYSVAYQQYVAAGESRFSFQRLTLDLGHQILLAKKTRLLLPSEQNGPDDCATSTKIDDPGHPCPSYKGPSTQGGGPTYDREGSIGLRLLLIDSFTASGHVVPFYFQPTLGGSDINGRPTLASYPDYRFRAPNLLLLQGNIEHTLYGPVGVTFQAETGRVALRRGDLEFKHLLHSYAAGLTLRAGGLPAVYLMFAWGGHEGTHTIASVSPTLLGGSSRPSLY